MAGRVPMPEALKMLYSQFPLRYTAAILPPPLNASSSAPVLWIAPPLATSKYLSTDVECLKWQAYIALRGLKDINIRWDIYSSGGIDGRLPCLWIPPLDSERQLSRGELLGARTIPGWADEIQGEHVWNTESEGYIDENARDESRAWVALLEGVVHAALLIHQSTPSPLSAWLYSPSPALSHMSATLCPPPAPMTGYNSVIPCQGTNIQALSLHQRYQEAISALSERLGTDKWFLGSSGPTPLDALIFAYLHIALHPQVKNMERARTEITHHVNLVAWERKVRFIVQGAFKAVFS
ncbi:hypothetical protein Clacol_004766 [Clathrus columnatus]|uniref:Metaxin glutathione S-transferase domain-containing protein n=1 Tax=Clathrus columnatus TaxID=1419009 RepID=A0AAV5ACV2_9AGAM|nr:hypothetical protein Clacol_004766 [Clathrus columnatus]